MFALAAESQSLRDEPRTARDGHRQITLFRGGGLSILLFDFERGGWLKDHAADGYVIVQVLSGEIRIATADEEYRMPAGSLLVLKPGIRHDVRAEAESRMLLTVRLNSLEDDQP